MAKITPQRRVALDTPEGIMDWAQFWLERLKPYAKWLGLGALVIAVVIGAWNIHSWIKTSRETKAAAALAQVTLKLNRHIPAAAAAQDLEKFVKAYPGSRAAGEAQLLRANLLYGLKQYGEAATAYESLLGSPDPGWNALVSESLSYCYEGLGNFKKAAAVLKPVVDQTYGPLKNEVMRRLAMLFEEAKEPKEAAVYWRKLLDRPSDAALRPYFQEKLAAAEAKSKK